ncbi:581_t:CDS:2 [Paraglomus brasilianum]|uniref:581_t:CDS:1 n=1 Tax=Paraglomus brasilianum TaxID=144538 RepID=A0A9N9BYD3_9GLOM|nr:581_t:CDS:2 [Paraglomus brasilianum]
MSETATKEKKSSTGVVRKYKTKELIDFLRKEKDLELDDDDLNIIKKQKIGGGPASDLADFAKELGKRKLKSFLSYKTQKDLRSSVGL